MLLGDVLCVLLLRRRELLLDGIFPWWPSPPIASRAVAAPTCCLSILMCVMFACPPRRRAPTSAAVSPWQSQWQFALALCPLRLRPLLPPPTSPPPYLLTTRQTGAWACLRGISRCRQFASADASYSSPLPGLYTFPPSHPFPREQGIALSRAAPWFRRGAVLAPFPFRVIQSSRFLSLGGATWFATLCVV